MRDTYDSYVRSHHVYSGLKPGSILTESELTDAWKRGHDAGYVAGIAEGRLQVWELLSAIRKETD